MAKSKINQVLEKLKDIELWASMGLSESQIAFNLGISRSSLENYKKANLDILKALKKGKNQANFKVENALFKKATGYKEKKKVAIKLKDTYYDEDGKKCTSERIQLVEVEEIYPAEIQAIKFWLVNKDKANWTENPTKKEIDRALLKLKQDRAKEDDW